MRIRESGRASVVLLQCVVHDADSEQDFLGTGLFRQPGGSTGNGAGSSRNSGSGGGDLRGADTGAIGPESTASGRNVTVNVWGHVIGTSGVGELCNMLTDAVVNSGHTLTAMNTTTGVQLQR